MAKIKHTKTELKAQRESLKRFERYLPMLQLKKQQLQLELQGIDAKIAARSEADRAEREKLDRWIALFAEPIPIADWLHIEAVDTDVGNIAGCPIPIFRDVRFRREAPDLFATPPWVDAGLDALEALLRAQVELRILAEQRRRIEDELRTTTQRVNLFEKVKIPECRDNIRIIRIFLGDEQTAGVARAKIAKGRSEEAIPA